MIRQLIYDFSDAINDSKTSPYEPKESNPCINSAFVGWRIERGRYRNVSAA